jgi:putative inorganic carbon (HCO3(-)) transporter
MNWPMRHSKPERVLFTAFTVLLLWLPIPIGSNRPWSWMLMEIVAFALVGGWLVVFALGRVALPEALRRSWPAWIAIGAWVALQALQVIPLPAAWVGFLSPASARLHALATAAGGDSGWITLSIDPQASRVSLIKTLAYVAIFFLALVLANKRSRVARLAELLVYAALAHSIYAVMMHLAGVQSEYFGILIRHADSASGTFVNRNHFAGYLEMSLAIGIGLLIAGLSDRSVDTWRKFVRLTLEWILSPKMILRLTLCVLVIALTTTHSRMGNAAFFSSLLVAGAIGIALSRYATRNTVLLLASLIAIDLFVVGSWFGVEKVAKRIQETTTQDVESREEPPTYALDLIRDYPVFGAGPGSFYLAFPPYRKETITAFFDHAHNDYVEFAAESGVLGLAILAAIVIPSLGAAIRAQWQRRDPLMRGMSFASIMGVTSILIHSWVDFNLHIPANAALFMVLLAFGWISLYVDRREGAARTRVEEPE